MPSLASLLPPEEPQSASAVTEEEDAPLLELRTEAGPVYVRPSKWERIRLKWTFRHFHVLPPQVLSQSDQRLIEKLAHTAVVTPSGPVPSSAVFGVVEKIPPEAVRASSGHPEKRTGDPTISGEARTIALPLEVNRDTRGLL